MSDTSIPAATRKDHDLVVLFGLHFFSPFFAFLPFVCWTSLACPHCDRVFRRDYWPQNVRLGNGERICGECGNAFDDGSREWPGLAFGKKFRYFIPPGIQAVGGAGLFWAVFALIIAPRDVVNFSVGILLFAFFLSPVLAWSLIRLVFVLRSIRRFEDDPDVHRRMLVSRN
jgi:hypothetical protein